MTDVGGVKQGQTPASDGPKRKKDIDAKAFQEMMESHKVHAVDPEEQGKRKRREQTEAETIANLSTGAPSQGLPEVSSEEPSPYEPQGSGSGKQKQEASPSGRAPAKEGYDLGVNAQTPTLPEGAKGGVSIPSSGSSNAAGASSALPPTAASTEDTATEDVGADTSTSSSAPSSAAFSGDPSGQDAEESAMPSPQMNLPSFYSWDNETSDFFDVEGTSASALTPLSEAEASNTNSSNQSQTEEPLPLKPVKGKASTEGLSLEMKKQGLEAGLKGPIAAGIEQESPSVKKAGVKKKKPLSPLDNLPKKGEKVEQESKSIKGSKGEKAKQKNKEEETQDSSALPQAPSLPPLPLTTAEATPLKSSKEEKKENALTLDTEALSPSSFQAPSDQTSLPSPEINATPPVSSPFSTLHPYVAQLFERMVGVLTVMQYNGVTETTIHLNGPQFAHSPFFGSQILITEFDTARKNFNIEFLGNNEAVDLFQANSAELVAAFKKEGYTFKINRIDIGYMTESGDDATTKSVKRVRRKKKGGN